MENRLSRFFRSHSHEAEAQKTKESEFIQDIQESVSRLLPNPNMSGRKIDDETQHWVLDWREHMPNIYADNPHFQDYEPYSIALNRYYSGKKDERITLKMSWLSVGDIYFTLQNGLCEIETEYRTGTGETIELEEKSRKNGWNTVRLSRMSEALEFFIAEQEVRQAHYDTSSINNPNF